MIPTFRVLTQGLLPGQAREEAVARLAALFKRAPAQMAGMLDASPMVVKKGVTQEVAAQYVQALAGCGCAASIEPEQSAVQLDPETILPQLLRTEAGRAMEGDPLLIEIAGDLSIVYFSSTPEGATIISHSMLAGLGMTSEELQDLAADNLYSRIYSNIQIEKVQMQGPKGEHGPQFFHYLKVEEGLAAACLLLAPIWSSVGHLVKGDLRIAIPNASTCMFCGSEEELTLAMMSDIAGDVWQEAGTLGLSKQIFTLDSDMQMGILPPAVPKPRTAAVSDSMA